MYLAHPSTDKVPLGLSKSLAGAGQWRTATCKLSEDGDRCFLNIYVDVRPHQFDMWNGALPNSRLQEAILYQTVYLHLLNQTDIRQTDPSLFFRKDCIGLHCIA